MIGTFLGVVLCLGWMAGIGVLVMRAADASADAWLQDGMTDGDPAEIAALRSRARWYGLAAVTMLAVAITVGIEVGG